jgi:hypothetical protein
MDVLKRLQQIPTFSHFVKNQKQQSGIESLLVTPIQRLSRYNLLLRDMFDRTPPSHPDHTALQEAIGVIQRLCDRIDVCTSNAENTRVMTELALRNK